MRILGISAFFHDSAAALIDSDLGIVAAAEEERFTRKKHDNSFPESAISHCLGSAGLRSEDLDVIAFYEEPWTKFNRVLLNYVKGVGRSEFGAKQLFRSWTQQKLWVREIISLKLRCNPSKIVFVPHHLSHAYSAFGPSGFDTAACMTLDGVGEFETGTFGEFGLGGYKKLATHRFPSSLGLLYSAFAEFLGFEVNEGEFKVMGMAAYGDPAYVDRIKVVANANGLFGLKLDMSYFSFHKSTKTNLSTKFIDLFGPKRIPESAFLSADSDIDSFTNERSAVLSPQKYYADIAASLQAVIEEFVLNYARTLREVTGQSNLVYSGGVAYNSVLNGRLIRESGFENVFIQPAAGDSGSAIGAALAVLPKEELSKRELFRYRTGSLGKAYSEQEVVTAIRSSGLRTYSAYDDVTDLVGEVTNRLAQGQVGAICRGGFEFGPRALGYRSIIADPRTSAMKARVNHAVKFRELFRPFAPMVPLERAEEFFDFDSRSARSQPFQFMLAVTKVKVKASHMLQAVTHVDGTARVQIVLKDRDPFLHDLLMSFGHVTGVPVLLNTSFNRRGEPIVASPEDALLTFLWTDIDFLVLENFLIYKGELGRLNFK